MLVGGCVYFGRQQQTFSLRRRELNQQGAVVTFAYTHIPTQRVWKPIVIVGGVTAFIIGFNYNEKPSTVIFPVLWT